MNRKRTYRLDREEGLSIRPKVPRRKRACRYRRGRPEVGGPNEVGALDFMSDQLFDGWIVPAGLDEARMNRVMHFLRFATDTQRLADQAKYIAYSPARASSQPLVSTHADLGIEMAPFMPTNPENMTNYLVNNIEWWSDHQDEVEAKFQAWLGQ